MMVFILMLIGFLLLPVPLDLIALQWGDFGSWKFLANLFTHQLGHAGLFHLLGNYMFMIPYAIYLEARIGRVQFLAFYFLCGLLAAFSQVLGSESTAMIGSSGAAFGVFAGACALFDRTAWQRLAGFVVLGLALMVQFYLATGPFAEFTRVAYWAHFGGGTAGLALIHFYVKPWLQSSSQSKPEVKRTSRAS